jgi:biotin carboxylase
MPAVKVSSTFQDSQHAGDRDSYLRALRDKVIVFVSPGYSGKKFVFEKAHELGVKSVVIDSPGSWTIDLLQRGVIHDLITVDMNQSEDDQFDEAVRLLSESEYEVDGICTFVELSAPLTARLCHHFRVPGHSIESVRLARDKNLTRKVIRSTPSTSKYSIRSILIESGGLKDAAAVVGFPAVLKPVSGAASLGVQRVNTFSELTSTHHSIRQLLSELVVSSGALERKSRMETTPSEDSESSNTTDPSTAPPSPSGLANTAIVLEEYLTGQEVDIDVVLCDGQITFCEISDNGPTAEPFFGETYNNCPTLLSAEKQDELKKMSIAILTDAMGFDNGVFHVEAKYTPQGPRLIEVNCRMGGGPIRSLHLYRSGVDLVVEQLLLSVGFPSVPPTAPEGTIPCMGFVDVNATKSGSVKTLDFLDPIRHRPGVLYVTPFVSVGEHIIGPEEGQPTWLVEVMFTRDNPHDAATDSQNLYEEIQRMFEACYV